MGKFKNKLAKIFEKESHLEKYLEETYNVDITKKYGAFLILTGAEGLLVDYFFTLEEVKEFLESKPNFKEILKSKGCPEEYFAEKEIADEIKEVLDENNDEIEANLESNNEEIQEEIAKEEETADSDQLEFDFEPTEEVDERIAE